MYHADPSLVAAPSSLASVVVYPSNAVTPDAKLKTLAEVTSNESSLLPEDPIVLSLPSPEAIPTLNVDLQLRI